MSNVEAFSNSFGPVFFLYFWRSRYSLRHPRQQLFLSPNNIDKYNTSVSRAHGARTLYSRGVTPGSHAAELPPALCTTWPMRDHCHWRSLLLGPPTPQSPASAVKSHHWGGNPPCDVSQDVRMSSEWQLTQVIHPPPLALKRCDSGLGTCRRAKQSQHQNRPQWFSICHISLRLSTQDAGGAFRKTNQNSRDLVTKAKYFLGTSQWHQGGDTSVGGGKSAGGVSVGRGGNILTSD